MNSSYGALIARKIGGPLRTRPGYVDCPGGAVSFTFDDFPKTALTIGGAVLEKYGARGTYYTAAQLAGTENNLGRMFDPDDVVAAHQAGHEIACHTLNHVDCCRAGAAQVRDEVTTNSAQLAALTGAPPTNFAYPFGAISLTAKWVVAKRFVSCRGTGQGINTGAVDLADLLGLRICSRSFDETAMRRVIDRNRAENGWLIFYTHDIAERPSDYGCTPEQFETVVAYAAQQARVAPVRDIAATLN